MKSIKIVTSILILSTGVACKENKPSEASVSNRDSEVKNIQIQGHRGERGLMPENSIPGYIAAIEDGADIIELDVVISSDGKVVVSHEPYMSSKYVSFPDGSVVTSAEEHDLNLYKMTYDSIRNYDIGRRGNIDFPQQRKMAAYKPLLTEVVDSVENFLKSNNRKPVGYNIEIKSKPEEYGISQPEPEELTDMVMEILENSIIQGPVNIQSFDPAILEVMHRKYPEITLAYLVYKPGIDMNLNELTFLPEIYSPSYKLIHSFSFVDSIRSKGLKLIPWTVNDTVAIQRMDTLKVDGIISDFPGRVKALIRGK
ncbi:glycerophosphodiester phosphodiesterase family protein [Robertkochia solimangrovi]|uniref:glycerophosphodiester phosphodiesterase family protein n=1 Tax=Robertkochia solimangrovi TaxID=2213046 RepID=UPI00117FB282|nr:glycerophosphodiester phosphodiesterase family protein [Robertkochia solimangrovi]TRZ45728.1 glycerophosphodiester phosphodiesterase [Robertkochia solimangrovi]